MIEWQQNLIFGAKNLCNNGTCNTDDDVSCNTCNDGTCDNGAGNDANSFICIHEWSTVLFESASMQCEFCMVIASGNGVKVQWKLQYLSLSGEWEITTQLDTMRCYSSYFTCGYCRRAFSGGDWKAYTSFDANNGKGFWMEEHCQCNTH